MARFVGGAGFVPSPGGVRRLVIEQLAERWGYSVSGIRKLIYAGKIPADAYFQPSGPGGRIVFREDVIERLEREAG